MAAHSIDSFGGARQNGSGRLPDEDPACASFTVDARGRVLTWSPGAERIQGYRPEEIVGRNCSRFYMPDEAGRGVPEHHLGNAAADGAFSTEGWRLRKDGTRFWAVWSSSRYAMRMDRCGVFHRSRARSPDAR